MLPDREKSKSLGERASRAAALMTAQAIYTKGLGLVLQLVLAKLLLREEFGLYGLALTVYTFAAMFHQAGVLEVLIARQRSFRIWAGVGFWLSSTIGVLAFGITVLIAPLAAKFYQCDDPQALTRLICILAIVFPISAAGAVNRAKLQIEMRFRELALIGVMTASLDVALKVFFAYRGLGAFSFAYGAVITSIANLILGWTFAPVRIRLRPQIRRWKYLLHDGAMVVGSLICLWVIDEGDYVVLGRFESVGVVGLYFFAFRVSRHVMMILTFQLSRVLFPALSSLPTEAGRQVSAFIRAARLIAVVCLPACFAMSAIADPLVRLLFGSRWYDAIPLIQIMCLGMTIRTMSWPIVSLMKAQGRFRTHMIVVALSIGVFFPLTILGTWLGSATGLSIAIAVFYSASTVVEFAVAVAPSGDFWRHLRSVFAAPLLASLPAAIGGCAVAYLALPEVGLTPLVLQVAQIGTVLIVGGAGYVLMIRMLSPEVWRDALQRGMRILPSWLRGNP